MSDSAAQILPDANWSLIPFHMRGAVARYIGHGIPPGSFLTAVLSNDLQGACAKADDVNQASLVDYVRFLYCDAPSPCWGSPAKFDAWIARGGLAGREEEVAA